MRIYLAKFVYRIVRKFSFFWNPAKGRKVGHNTFKIWFLTVCAGGPIVMVSKEQMEPSFLSIYCTKNQQK
jgi:hypothetical protein